MPCIHSALSSSSGPLRWWATSMCSKAAGSCARQKSSFSFATHGSASGRETWSRKNWSPCVSREGRVCGSRALAVFVHLFWDRAISHRHHGWYFSGIVLISRNSNRFFRYNQSIPLNNIKSNRRQFLHFHIFTCPFLWSKQGSFFFFNLVLNSLWHLLRPETRRLLRQTGAVGVHSAQTPRNYSSSWLLPLVPFCQRGNEFPFLEKYVNISRLD